MSALDRAPPTETGSLSIDDQGSIVAAFAEHRVKAGRNLGELLVQAFFGDVLDAFLPPPGRPLLLGDCPCPATRGAMGPSVTPR